LFEKKSESKNRRPKLSPKHERTCDFHERTDKDSAVFWLVLSIFLRIMVIYQNRVFDFFEDCGYES
jgi:hypothetical protein